MTWMEILAELKRNPTVSVPIAGKVLGDLSRNGAYEAARAGKLGVPVLEIGGKKRVPSAAILRALGIDRSVEAA